MPSGHRSRSRRREDDRESMASVTSNASRASRIFAEDDHAPQTNGRTKGKGKGKGKGKAQNPVAEKRKIATMRGRDVNGQIVEVDAPPGYILDGVNDPTRAVTVVSKPAPPPPLEYQVPPERENSEDEADDDAASLASDAEAMVRRERERNNKSKLQKAHIPMPDRDEIAAIMDRQKKPRAPVEKVIYRPKLVVPKPEDEHKGERVIIVKRRNPIRETHAAIHVNKEDADIALRHPFHFVVRSKSNESSGRVAAQVYDATKRKSSTVYLSRLIAQAMHPFEDPTTYSVILKNENPFDLRRSNIRITREKLFFGKPIGELPDKKKNRKRPKSPVAASNNDNNEDSDSSLSSSASSSSSSSSSEKETQKQKHKRRKKK